MGTDGEIRTGLIEIVDDLGVTVVRHWKSLRVRTRPVGL